MILIVAAERRPGKGKIEGRGQPGHSSLAGGLGLTPEETAQAASDVLRLLQRLEEKLAFLSVWV